MTCATQRNRPDPISTCPCPDRVASKPAAEARMWMIAGIAGGIQPWWHHVGAYHEDRRMYRDRRVLRTCRRTSTGATRESTCQITLRMLANLVRWAARGELPLTVSGPGFVDCHLYEQPGRMILHLVNLTSEATWRAPLDELIPVGPFTVSIRLTRESIRPVARLLVSGVHAEMRVHEGTATLAIASILDHEVVVIG